MLSDGLCKMNVCFFSECGTYSYLLKSIFFDFFDVIEMTEASPFLLDDKAELELLIVDDNVDIVES